MGVTVFHICNDYIILNYLIFIPLNRICQSSVLVGQIRMCILFQKYIDIDGVEESVAVKSVNKSTRTGNT